MENVSADPHVSLQKYLPCITNIWNCVFTLPTSFFIDNCGTEKS